MNGKHHWTSKYPCISSTAKRLTPKALKLHRHQNCLSIGPACMSDACQALVDATGPLAVPGLSVTLNRGIPQGSEPWHPSFLPIFFGTSIILLRNPHFPLHWPSGSIPTPNCFKNKDFSWQEHCSGTDFVGSWASFKKVSSCLDSLDNTRR